MRHIQKNLMTVIILGIVVAAFTSGYLSLLSFTSISRDRSSEVLKNELELTAEFINTLCVEVEHSVGAMRDRCIEMMPSVQSFLEPEGEEYLEQTKRLAMSMVAYNENLAAVYYRINPEISTPTAGFFLSKSQRVNEIVEHSPTDLSLFPEDDKEHVGWFFIPKEAGKPVWVSQYLNLNNSMLTISFVEPIYAEDGTFVGVVGVDIDMSKVYERIAQTPIYHGGFAALMSAGGEIMFSSQPLNLSEKEIQEIVTQPTGFCSYVQQQKRMTVLSRQLVYGDYLLIAIADEALYQDETRVILTIVLLTMAVSLGIIAALTGLLNNLFHRFQSDSLTAAKNRAAYMDVASELEEQIRTRKLQFTLIVFDVNGLKYVNDNLGHAAGDQLLRHAAEEIRKYFPGEDLYRIGGDEFVILSRRKKQAYLTLTFQKLKEEMRDRKRRYEENPELVTVSMGMTKFDATVDSCLEDVFYRADQEMYADKAEFYQMNPSLDRRNRETT